MKTLYSRLRSLGLVSDPAAREARHNIPACGNFFPCQAGILDDYVSDEK